MPLYPVTTVVPYTAVGDPSGAVYLDAGLNSGCVTQARVLHVPNPPIVARKLTPRRATLRAYPSMSFRLCDLPQRLSCFREVLESLLPASALILDRVLLLRLKRPLGGALAYTPRHVWCGGRFQQHRDHLPGLF